VCARTRTHAFLERRYLIISGPRSSRIYVVDTKPNPTKAAIHKIIEPEEVFEKTGYSRPHTVRCGPEGIYICTLGGGGNDGTDGPHTTGCAQDGVAVVSLNRRVRIMTVFGAPYG
jgi:hypothetical protein